MSETTDDPTHAEEVAASIDRMIVHNRAVLDGLADYDADDDHRARVAAAIDFMIKRYQKTLDYLADK